MGSADRVVRVGLIGLRGPDVREMPGALFKARQVLTNALAGEVQCQRAHRNQSGVIEG